MRTEVKSYEPGTFCWWDLSTTDPTAAKQFYGAMFGWRLEDTPAGPDMTYTMAYVGAQTIGAISAMSPGETAAGVPPHWNSYVSVADVDATAAKVEGLGGKLLMAPFDVMDVGRMAVVQDPTGAVLCVWQAKSHIGSGLVGEPGTVCWSELLTHDIEQAKAFYTGLFGWTTDTMDMGDGQHYTLFKRGGENACGMMKLDPAWGPMPSSWSLYFLVGDADAAVAKATSLGAKSLMPIQEVPGVGRFTMLLDPTGAAFEILAPS